jgi:NAD(P)-dependent dehydrogenase (short-subunit alcohol dehydrogenase family)
VTLTTKGTEKKMGKLDGKIALITGASEGIGLATAQHFVAEGAEHVFITGRRQAVLDEAVEKIGSKNVTAVQGDVSNMADLDKLYSVIQKEKGHLDILCANAGATTEIVPLGSITEEDFDHVINTNMKGVLFTVQKALPIFVNGGSIILTGSSLSIKGSPGLSVYAASRAALRSFARTWTVDLKDRQIRVNVLSPGPIDTNAMARRGATEEGRKFLDTVKAALPMNRFGMPDEIAKAAVFLASDDSSYVTGIELFVDGGMVQI